MNTLSVTHICRRLFGAIAGVLIAVALGITPAHAVLSDGFFELDGNTVDSPAGGADDWNNFLAAPCEPNCGGTSHTTKATGIISDTTPAVFRGGSKDIQDISAWRYDLGSSPPKDDMLHAYAAAYTATTTTATTTAGDLLIYFGADRASFNGTASLGFWFFKNPVARNDATGRFINPVTNGPATHAEGDVLLAFEYTNGGAVTDVHWYKWTSGSLQDMGTIGVSATSVATVFCDADDKLCGSTNGGALTIPWNGTIQPGQFFEGGVNIPKLLLGGDLCFSAFMATSRSSDQPNASIKNFILGSFPVCHLTVSKQCESAVFQPGDSTVLNTVVGRILNDGGGALTNITLSDNPSFTSSQFLTCNGAVPADPPVSKSAASLAVGDSICYRGTYTSNTLDTSDTVTASASTGSGTVSGTATATCHATANPGLSVNKTCNVSVVTQNGLLAVKVNYSGSVTNGQVALTNVKVCEAAEVAAGVDPCNVAGHAEISIGDMAAGEVKTYNGFYFPSTALNGSGDPTTIPADAQFKDKVSAFGTKPAILGGGPQTSPATEAMCPLCVP